jgi:hypothetical protein
MDAEGSRDDDGGRNKDRRHDGNQLGHDPTLAAHVPSSSHPWVSFGWSF